MTYEELDKISKVYNVYFADGKLHITRRAEDALPC